MGAGDFAWPDSYAAAVSLTFDDARLTQVDNGLPLFAEFDVRCSFYVSLPGVEERLEGWRGAVAAGHEIGNHSLSHPCSANYEFARSSGACTEDLGLGEIERDIATADRRIEELLGVRPATFAYPCGETHVGRGSAAASYVPLVAQRFLAGRGYQHDHPNDPRYCDLAHLLSSRFDVQPPEQLIDMVDKARRDGEWLIFSGHEIGFRPDYYLNISLDTITTVLRYLKGLRDSVWVAPVEEIAAWVAGQHGKTPVG